ncbi:MAG TPA: serine hydrolase domain-containing protein [Kofleriaceae bacterium]|nr:serine hydrolase domain-containing protein [Kofleriaceae bacterium]
MTRRLASLALLAAACSAPASSAPTTPVAGEEPRLEDPSSPASPTAALARKLTADTPLETAAGTTLTAASGWWVTETDPMRLQDPDRELSVWLVDVATAKTRVDAVADAWKRAVPGFALEVAQDDSGPGREGWDEIGSTDYVTKAAESRVVVAVARRKGSAWSVALLDGKAAAVQRRGAQLGTILESVRIAGMERESLAGRTADLSAAKLEQWVAFVDQARIATKVPGVAIAVVHKGKVILAKGLGVRALGKKAPVTPDTRFMIGSTTKSLTTLMMARLVDRGLFTWETPAAQVLPSFKLADAATTAAVQMMHTVCACTGMPRQDFEFIFEYGGWTPERRIGSLASMRPTTGFGETFQYSNLMVSTGGYAAAHALAPKKKLGPAYDAAMQSLVFGPLGMRSTTFDYKKAMRGNAALPHAAALTLDQAPIPIGFEEAIIPVRPAGAAWSTARDLARFVALELARGKLPGGKPLVTEANLLRRRAPQVKINDDTQYGLGLFLSKEHGLESVGHGGNTLGFTSDLFFLPAHDVGVVVLTNAGGANLLRNVVHRRFEEIVLGARPEAEEDLKTSLERDEKSLAEERALLRPAIDWAWATPYLGEFSEPALGTLVLARDGERLTLDAGEWKSDLAHKVGRDGTPVFMTVSPGITGLELIPQTKDGQPELVIDAGQQVYRFRHPAR